MQLPTNEIEEVLRRQGFAAVAGVDEAGAGCWAGPVFAAAVILPAGFTDKLVRDSKKLSARQREKAAALIKENSVAWSVGSASAAEIDKFNIRNADALAMRRAVAGLSVPADYVIVDGFVIREYDAPQQAIIRGDSISSSIAAASIIAKTSRDALCSELALRYPEYGFDQHKGYGTAAHQAALQRHGPCAEHRMTYAPIRNLIMINAT